MANSILLSSRWRCGIVLLCGLAGLLPTVVQAEPLSASQENADLPDRGALQPVAEAPVVAPQKLHSPGIQIVRTAQHIPAPEDARVDVMPPRYQWSKLMPSAGGADLEAMVPLIPVPNPADVHPVPMPPAAAATGDIPPPPSVQEVPTPYDGMALDRLVQQVEEPYGRVSTAPEALPQVPAVTVPAAPITQPAAPKAIVQTEPSPELSDNSRAILNKIPSHLDGRRADGPTAGVDINRTKDAKYVSKPQETETPETPETEETAAPQPSARSEAMGMKLAVKQAPVNVDYELEKAYNALLGGHTQAAIEIYRLVLSNAPNNQDALFGLATTYHRAGQIDMARPLYGKLLSINPQHRDGLNNFLVLLADEAPQEAIVEMEKLEEKHPSFSPIPAQLAVIYQKIGQTDKASDKMFKAVALEPANLTYRYNLAILLDKQHKTEEALKLYGQLVEAHMRGESVPGNIQKIQERLTFLRSNR